MPPETRERRPRAGSAALQDVAADASKDTVTTDILWRLAEQCPPEAIRWFGIGWQSGQIDGFTAGWDAGFAAAEHDMEIAWFALACKVRRDAARPTFAELQRRRGVA